MIIQNILFKPIEESEDEYRSIDLNELILKQFHKIDGIDNLLLDENEEVYIKSEFYENKSKNKNIHAIKIVPGDKISCTNEKALFGLDRELHNLGYKTRVARNEAGMLSIAILKSEKQ